jgi:hypothetical protein
LSRFLSGWSATWQSSGRQLVDEVSPAQLKLSSIPAQLPSPNSSK